MIVFCLVVSINRRSSGSSFPVLLRIPIESLVVPVVPVESPTTPTPMVVFGSVVSRSTTSMTDRRTKVSRSGDGDTLCPTPGGPTESLVSWSLTSVFTNKNPKL